jgi:hypothetical protein
MYTYRLTALETLFLAAVFAAVFGCNSSTSNTTEHATDSKTLEAKALTQAEADAAAVRMAALLPDMIGSFAAKEKANIRVYLPNETISADREYTSESRTLTVELKTGNIQSEQRIIATDEEHTFLSDTPTFWRTVEVKGRRARIAENRDSVVFSEIYVRVGPYSIVHLTVGPTAKPGESAALAAMLNLDAVEAAGIKAPRFPEPLPSPNRRR